MLSGVVTAFGITVHNFPEGLAIFLASKKSTKLGLTLTAAMTLHNLPEVSQAPSPCLSHSLSLSSS